MHRFFNSFNKRINADALTRGMGKICGKSRRRLCADRYTLCSLKDFFKVLVSRRFYELTKTPVCHNGKVRGPKHINRPLRNMVVKAGAPRFRSVAGGGAARRRAGRVLLHRSV